MLSYVTNCKKIRNNDKIKKKLRHKFNNILNKENIIHNESNTTNDSFQNIKTFPIKLIDLSMNEY